jgi:chemotaxis protein histidine kinase CheA
MTSIFSLPARFLVSRFRFVLAAFALIWLPSVGLAQLSESGRLSLSATIQSARQSLDSTRLPVYADAETGVKQDIEAVEAYFRPISTEANTAKWMQYLETEPLLKSLQSGESTETILDLAQRTHGRLIGNIDGLELAPLRTLRTSLERLMASIRLRDSEKSIKLIDQQLQSLDERILKAATVPSAEEAASLAAISKLIGESNQSPSVPAALRGAFSRPNVVISVGSSLVQQAAYQVVERSRAINDCILGTRIVGNGQLQGNVSARTLASYGQAAVELTLSANFHSQSTGYNGPVQIKTLGNGDVRSNRTIYISEAGIALAPTATTASLSSKITSINHPLRLVRKIASKKAAQLKPQADAIATERLRKQVGSEFDAQVTQAVAAAPAGDRQAAIAKARTTLNRLNVPEPSRTIGSNEHSIFLEATQAAGDQFAAVKSAPAMAPGSFDLAIQVHESTVDNVASRILAGRTMTGEQLDRLMADAGRPPRSAAVKQSPSPTTTPEELSAKTDSELADNDETGEEDSFVIDFAKFRPIVFEARDQTLRIGLRGTRFQQGERELSRPLEITANYRPIQSAVGKTYFERTGDVDVDFPGGRRLTIGQVALKKSIQKAFDSRFPQTLLDQAIALPTTLPIESMRGQSLNISTIDSNDGWLSISAR